MSPVHTLPPLTSGQRLGAWTLRRPLGEGAFGVTWMVADVRGGTAALKVLGAPAASELTVLSTLVHPAVPRLLDHGETGDGAHYLVMELAPGRPLEALLADGALPPDAVARLGATLLDALATVHQAGVAHGDIKPENLLVALEAPVPLQLIDFGLANGQGGTAAWAAPEQLAGGGAAPAADVYAAGLVLWAALEGGLPHAELPAEEALARRCRAVPATTRGPAWLRALVAQMLDPDPAARPDAARAADTFAAHGLALPAVGAGLIARRARVAHVARPRVARATRRWRDRGGRLGLIGPPGSGRSRELERLAIELAAAGRPALRVPEGLGGEAWSGVTVALGELGLDLPVAPDDATRAHSIAETLHAAGRPVLVDGLDEQDEGTRRVVAILCELEATLCFAAATVPEAPCAQVTTCALDPLDAPQIHALVGQILGQDDEIHDLEPWLVGISGGHPGAVSAALVAAVEAEALVRHHHRWVFDASRAPAELSADQGLRLPAPGSLAHEILSLLALHRLAMDEALLTMALPAGVDRLAREAATGALVDARLALRTADGLRCAAGARSEVLATVDEPEPLRRRLLRLIQRRGGGAPLALVEHAVALGDRNLVRAHGLAAIASLRTRNPLEAVQLAERAWAVVPEPEFAVARVRVLLAAGRTAEARHFGEARWAEDAGPASVPLMVELAQLSASHDGDADRARAWVERVRTLLDGAPGTPALDLVDALSSDILGEHQRALELSLALSAAPAPTDEDALERWLRARTIAAQSMHHLGDLDGAIALLSEVPAGLGLGMGARAVLSAALSRLLWFAGRYKDADAALTAAAQGDSGLPMLDRARLLNNLGAVRHHSGNRPQAVAAWEQALVLFRRLEAEYEMVRVQSNLCVGYRELGRWERARATGAAALHAARRLSLDELECHAALNLAELDVVHGALDEAELRIERAAELAERAQLSRILVEARLRRIELAAHRRVRSQEQVEAARALVQEAEAKGMMLEGALGAALVALNLVRMGTPWRTAKTWAERAVAPLQAAGAAADLALVRTWLAEALLEAQRPQEAAALVDRVRVFARESGLAPLTRRAEQITGRVGSLWTDPKRDARVSRLVTLAVAINEQSDLQSVLGRIAEASLALLEGDRTFVLMGEPPEVVAAAFTEGQQGEPSMSVVRQCIEDDREVIAADLDERGDLRDQRSIVAMSLRSVLCVPMRHQGTIIGAIYVDSRSASQQHLWESAELMRGLAAMAAVALVKVRYFEATVEQARVAARLAERERVARELAEKNAQLEGLNEQLRKAVVTDPLTSLFNRRHLTELIQKAHQRCATNAVPGGYGVIICDIDHFKRINDTWGHPVGDRVLVETAARMRDAVRSNDLVFRYGGEEMVVLTRDTDGPRLAALGERLRQAVRGTPVEVGDGEHRTITVSVGCAVYHPDHDPEWSAVVHRADVALYAAKSGGRDQVVMSVPGDEAAHGVA